MLRVASTLTRQQVRGRAAVVNIRAGGRRLLCADAAAGQSSHLASSSSSAVPKPTAKQLTTLALASGVPFIGFGFADNAIMSVVSLLTRVSVATLTATNSFSTP